MKTATYTNTQTNETTTRKVEHMGHAYQLSGEVCDKMNWNENMFTEDVKLTITK
tara:strand:+ start:54 stop:215 length:162 start_codon:yes stop_codon:yes gene_type:complete